MMKSNRKKTSPQQRTGELSAHDALRISEARYQDLYDNVPVGLFQTTTDGRIINVNLHTLNILGYADQESILGKTTADFYAFPEMRDNLLQKLLEEHILRSTEIMFQKPDGSTFWGEINIQEKTDCEGKLLCFEGTIQDITHRKDIEAQQERQLEELRVLNKVAAECATATDVNTLIQSIAIWLAEWRSPDKVAILITDNDQQMMHGYHAVSSQDKKENFAIDIPFGKGIIGSVVTSGQVWRIADFTSLSEYRDLDSQTLSELCIPIIADGEILGALDAKSSRLNAFSEGDEQLFFSLAGQMATAITKIRLLESERRRLREAETLGLATAAVVSSLHPDHLLEIILSHLNQVVPSSQSIVVMLEGNQMRVVAGTGFSVDHSLLGNSDFVDHTLIDQLLDTMQPKIYHLDQVDAIKHLWGTFASAPNKSWMNIPLIVRDHMIGFISLSKDSVSGFSESDMSLSQIFANQAAAAIENARLFEQTQRWAYELEAVMNVSSSLRQASTALEMVPLLIEQIIEACHSRGASLFLLEDRNLTLAESRGAGEILAGTQFCDKEKDPLWEVVRTGEILVIPGASFHKKSQINKFIEMVMVSTPLNVIVPLKSPSSVVGLLHIEFSDYTQEIPQRYQRMLIAIAEIGGNALHRANVLETLEQRIDARTSNLTTLHAISEVSSKAGDLHNILASSLDKILDAMNASTGSIHLLSPGSDFLCLAVHHGFSDAHVDALQEIQITSDKWDWRPYLEKQVDPVLIVDLQTDKRIPPNLPVRELEAFVGIPFGTEGQPMGVLSFFGEAVRNFTSGDVEILETIAEQIRSAVERDHLQKQAEEVAKLEERQRLARDLHDSVTQEIYSVSLMANAARKLAASGNVERAEHYLHELGNTAQQALKEMRLLIYEMRPFDLENTGLKEALRQRLETVERRSGIEVHLEGDYSRELPPIIEEGFYGIAIEALNNILKHAAATSISVRLVEDSRHFILEIEDNGCGFDADRSVSNGGIGLTSMQERAATFDGLLELLSRPGKGTRVTIRVK
jgi:PAS domain S-box-containing protein